MTIIELSIKGKSIYTLFKIGKIKQHGLNKALQDEIITNEEYNFILESFEEQDEE